MQSIRNARCHKKEHLAKVVITPPPPLLFTTDVADSCSLGCKMDLTVPQGLG